MMVNKILIFSLLSLLFSCNSTLPDADYVEWVTSEKSGMRKIKTVAPYIFDLQHLPARYRTLLYSSSEQDSLVHFNLTIETVDKNTNLIDIYTQNIQDKRLKEHYFSYVFAQSICLELDNGECLKPSLFHFEKSMDIKNGRTFIMAFDNKISSAKNLTLILDSDILGVGLIKLNIEI